MTDTPPRCCDYAELHGAMGPCGPRPTISPVAPDPTPTEADRIRAAAQLAIATGYPTTVRREDGTPICTISAPRAPIVDEAERRAGALEERARIVALIRDLFARTISTVKAATLQGLEDEIESAIGDDPPSPEQQAVHAAERAFLAAHREHREEMGHFLLSNTTRGDWEKRCAATERTRVAYDAARSDLDAADAALKAVSK